MPKKTFSRGRVSKILVYLVLSLSGHTHLINCRQGIPGHCQSSLTSVVEQIHDALNNVWKDDYDHIEGLPEVVNDPDKYTLDKIYLLPKSVNIRGCAKTKMYRTDFITLKYFGVPYGRENVFQCKEYVVAIATILRNAKEYNVILTSFNGFLKSKEVIVRESIPDVFIEETHTRFVFSGGSTNVTRVIVSPPIKTFEDILKIMSVEEVRIIKVDDDYDPYDSN